MEASFMNSIKQYLPEPFVAFLRWLRILYIIFNLNLSGLLNYPFNWIKSFLIRKKYLERPLQADTSRRIFNYRYEVLPNYLLMDQDRLVSSSNFWKTGLSI
jgi:hypothetical protein